MRQIERNGMVLLVLAIVCGAVLVGVSVAGPGEDREGDRDYDPKELIVSEETTYLTEPLNDDGTVNYHKYLEEQASDGVTPENNAAIGILQVMGPEAIYGREDAEAIVPLAAEALGVSVETLCKDMTFQDFDDFCTDRDWELHPDTGWEERPDWWDVREHLQAHPWSAQEYPIPAEWVAANEDVLDHVVAGLAKPGHYLPDICLSDPPTYEVGRIRLGHLMMLTRALTVRAMFRVASGDPEGAWGDIYAIRQLARHMGDGNLLQYMISMGLDRIALDAQEALLREGSPDADLLEQMVDDIALLKAPSFVDAVRGERLFSLAIIQSAYAGHIPEDDRAIWFSLTEHWDGESVNVNHYMRRVNAMNEQMVRVVDQPYYGAILAQWDDEYGDIQDEEFTLDVDAMMAKMDQEPTILTWGEGEDAEAATDALIDAGRPSELAHIRQMVVASGEFTARRVALDVAIALERYRMDHGEYPGELEALVPAYLDEVPADPFDGEPMRYLLTGDAAVVYSVGANLTDDGGVSAKYSGGSRECQTCDDDCPHDDVSIVLQRKD